MACMAVVARPWRDLACDRRNAQTSDEKFLTVTRMKY